MPTYLRDSGLFVSERVTDSDDVERALQQIGHPAAHRLFVTREVDRAYQRFVWRVMLEDGDNPPANLCEWRDRQGVPLPLSHGLVEKAKAQLAQGDADQVIARIEQANQDHRDRLLRAEEEAFEEIARDLGGRINRVRSPLFQRGAHLRRAREKSLRTGRDARRDALADRLFSAD